MYPSGSITAIPHPAAGPTAVPNDGPCRRCLGLPSQERGWLELKVDESGAAKLHPDEKQHEPCVCGRLRGGGEGHEPPHGVLDTRLGRKVADGGGRQDDQVQRAQLRATGEVQESTNIGVELRP